MMHQLTLCERVNDR